MQQQQKHHNGTRAGVGLTAWVNGHWCCFFSPTSAPLPPPQGCAEMCSTAELGHSSVMHSPVCLPSVGKRKLTPKSSSSLHSTRALQKNDATIDTYLVNGKFSQTLRNLPGGKFSVLIFLLRHSSNFFHSFNSLYVES